MFGDGFIPAHAGKQLVTAYNTRTGGLIPAHAGKTAGRRQRTSRPRAHPRSRGENTTVGTMPGAGPGSSPLTRGKHILARFGCEDAGLIPAHAGKTAQQAHKSCAPRAHPRSRGENAGSFVFCPKKCGSSPLTRGKLPVIQRDQAARGLIPAHAGKTRGTRAGGAGY